jgi:hypothetical protein
MCSERESREELMRIKNLPISHCEKVLKLSVTFCVLNDFVLRALNLASEAGAAASLRWNGHRYSLLGRVANIK